MKNLLISNKSGFTLIELLVVVLILGILFQLAIPLYVNASDAAKYSQAELHMSRIFRALETYYIENGGYPPDVNPGEAPPGLVPNYMDYWPSVEDDPFNAQFDYEAWDVAGSKYREGFIGATRDVLWESCHLNENGEWNLSGLTDNYIRVYALAENDLWNRITPVYLEENHSGRNALTGSLVT